MKIKVRSTQEIPNNYLSEELELEFEDFYYIASFGVRIGFIGEDIKKSYLTQDRDNDNTEILDYMIKNLKTVRKWASILNGSSRKLTKGEYIYLPYINEEHCSFLPTITDRYVDNCSNVSYDITYEICFAAGDGCTRYVTIDYKTQGSFSMSPYSNFCRLEDIFESMFENNENGFGINEDNEKFVYFFDEFGERIYIDIHNTSQLFDMICSIRVIKLDTEIMED